MELRKCLSLEELNQNFHQIICGSFTLKIFLGLFYLPKRNLQFLLLVLGKKEKYKGFNNRHSSFSSGSYMYIFGGTDNSGNSIKDLWRFNREDHKWNIIECEGYDILPRHFHSSVVSEHIVYTFGGKGKRKYILINFS